MNPLLDRHGVAWYSESKKMDPDEKDWVKIRVFPRGRDWQDFECAAYLNQQAPLYPRNVPRLR